MGRGFKETAHNNIDQEKYKKNYDDIFRKKENSSAEEIVRDYVAKVDMAIIETAEKDDEFEAFWKGQKYQDGYSYAGAKLAWDHQQKKIDELIKERQDDR